MSSLFIFIGIGVFFFVALSLWNRSQRKQGREEQKEVGTADSECCGLHEVCEKKASKSVSRRNEADYFDDEELDRHRNKSSLDYSEEEVEEFREIFYSLLDSEKFKWIKSLHNRRIAVPDSLKGEIIEIINNLPKRNAQA
ncbi:MAG: phospholipase [Dysgonamonadaceae bacterium]|jgi:hypothetical protein|nr:phospholipase [Dysgonamonadaceae bacterium]